MHQKLLDPKFSYQFQIKVFQLLLKDKISENISKRRKRELDNPLLFHFTSPNTTTDGLMIDIEGNDIYDDTGRIGVGKDVIDADEGIFVDHIERFKQFVFIEIIMIHQYPNQSYNLKLIVELVQMDLIYPSFLSSILLN